MTRFYVVISIFAAILLFTKCKKGSSECADIGGFPELPGDWKVEFFEIPGTDAQYWNWSLRFIDSENGFRFGADSVLLATTDSGHSWKTTKVFGGEVIKSLTFLDKKHFFLSTYVPPKNTASGIADGLLYRSDDGGASWQEIRFDSAGTLRNLIFVDENNGLAFNEIIKSNSSIYEAYLVRTSDGGLNWEKLPDTGDAVPVSGTLNIHPNGFGYFGSADGNVWLTTDAGFHWKAFPTPLNYFTGLQFTDPLTGFASDANRMVKTSDGGQTWSTIAAQGTDFFHFFSPTDGLSLQVVKTIEEDGQLFFCQAFFWTSDGGQTWEQGQTDKDFYPHHFFFLDDKTGFVTTDSKPGRFARLTR